MKQFRYMYILISCVALLLVSILPGCINSGDSDGDGLTDNQEKSGWDVSVYMINGSIKIFHVTSDPNKVDTDGDGLSDYKELTNPGGALDPSSKDTDGDGLSDYDELNVYNTSPTSQDSDYDHLSDGLEVRGWNITVRGENRHVTSDPNKIDTDGDGLSDYDEWNGTNGFKTNPSDKDTDGDGVSDNFDINPLWNIKINIELDRFTLTHSPDTLSKPYFYIKIGTTNYTFTKKIGSMADGEMSYINKTYTFDINDYKWTFPPKIEITAFDNNTQVTQSYGIFKLKHDLILKINGTSDSWRGCYTTYPHEEKFTASGTNGVLNFTVFISEV